MRVVMELKQKLEQIVRDHLAQVHVIRALMEEPGVSSDTAIYLRDQMHSRERAMEVAWDKELEDFLRKEEV